ncbi:MAG: ribokinase, partial [Planctomycetota bacterium]
QAVRFASLAGAIAATRHGAQPSLPLRSEIESLRDQHV